MITIKRLQLGLIHAAVAITLVPINSTLNRIMIEDLGISATLVVLLFSLPYLLSFIQVAIGSFSDRRPIMGYRRTPYIAFGLLLCLLGLLLSTQAAFLIKENFWVGLGLGLLIFGAWGMGFNFATVSYFSLASEISSEKDRAKTTAIMFFVMVVSIIITAAGLSRMLEPFTPERLNQAFQAIAFLALVMGVLGLLGLERRTASIQQAEDALQSTHRLSRGFVESSGKTVLLLPYFDACGNLRPGCAPGAFRSQGICFPGERDNPDHLDLGNVLPGFACDCWRP